jgi:hypothetical protein
MSALFARLDVVFSYAHFQFSNSPSNSPNAGLYREASRKVETQLSAGRFRANQQSQNLLHDFQMQSSIISEST